MAGLDPRTSLDYRALDTLKRDLRTGDAAATRDATKLAAKKFEAEFLNLLMKQMRAALPQEDPLTSDTSRSWQAMADQRMTEALSARGVGLADMIEKQLTRNRSTDASKAAAAAQMVQVAQASAALNADAGNTLGNDSATRDPLAGTGITGLNPLHGVKSLKPLNLNPLVAQAGKVGFNVNGSASTAAVDAAGAASVASMTANASGNAGYSTAAASNANGNTDASLSTALGVTAPNTSTPNTSTPNTSTPNTSTPNTSTPNTSTPNTSTPNTSTPNIPRTPGETSLRRWVEKAGAAAPGIGQRVNAGTVRQELGKQRAFVDKVNAEAQVAAQQTGLPAEYMVGQAALESGWGKSEIKAADGTQSFNLFGIKAGRNWTGKTIEVTTTEYINGSPQKVKAKFRAYDSYAEGFADYAKLIQNSPRYAGVRQAGSATEFARALQRGGYATDPAYAQKLASTIQSAQRISRSQVA